MTMRNQATAGASRLANVFFFVDDGWILTSVLLKAKLRGRGWEERTRLGITGKGCEVSVGERAAWERAPLGRRRDQVSLQHDTLVCWAGHFQPVSVVLCCLCGLSSVP